MNIDNHKGIFMKRFSALVSIVLFGVWLPSFAEASQDVAKFTAPGVYLWTVPPGVTQIIVNATAAGSGSGSVNNGNAGSACMVAGNSGLNGQAVYEDKILVNPGDALRITVGAGGYAGHTAILCNAFNDGGPGGNTLVEDLTAGTTLESMVGGGGYLVPPQAQCIKPCIAVNAYSYGMSAWSDSASGMQSYFSSLPFFTYIMPANLGRGLATQFSGSALWYTGNCLAAQVSPYYGGGASSVTMNGVVAPNTRCNGEVGQSGAVAFRW